MKAHRWLFALFGCAGAVGAQNYQYQYPSDPYNPTPKPQPTYQSSYSSSWSGHSYEKLLTYGSLEARYNYNDFKDSDLENSSGFSIGLRAPLFKPLFLSFGLNWKDGANDQSESFNLATLTGGAGVFLPIGSRFHLFGEAGVRWDISGGELNFLNPDTFAVYMRPGMRIAATERLEFAASVLFSTTDNLDQNIVELNSYFALLSVLDLGVGVDFADDINTYHAGLRLRW